MFISVDPTKDKSWTSGVPANVVVDGVHTKDASVKKGEDEVKDVPNQPVSLLVTVKGA